MTQQFCFGVSFESVSFIDTLFVAFFSSLFVSVHMWSAFYCHGLWSNYPTNQIQKSVTSTLEWQGKHSRILATMDHRSWCLCSWRVGPGWSPSGVVHKICWLDWLQPGMHMKNCHMQMQVQLTVFVPQKLNLCPINPGHLQIFIKCHNHNTITCNQPINCILL